MDGTYRNARESFVTVISIHDLMTNQIYWSNFGHPCEHEAF